MYKMKKTVVAFLVSYFSHHTFCFPIVHPTINNTFSKIGSLVTLKPRRQSGDRLCGIDSFEDNYNDCKTAMIADSSEQEYEDSTSFHQNKDIVGGENKTIMRLGQPEECNNANCSTVEFTPRTEYIPKFTTAVLWVGGTHPVPQKLPAAISHKTTTMKYTITLSSTAPPLDNDPTTTLNSKVLAQRLTKQDLRISVVRIDEDMHINMKRLMHQYTVTVPVGVVLDAHCDNTQHVINQASTNKLFDGVHTWLIFTSISDNANLTGYIDTTFSAVNLSIDADIAVVAHNVNNNYTLIDVYNFGRRQGNPLEQLTLGYWSFDSGLKITLSEYKYYSRWDFHKLTLRAISVIVEQPKSFSPEILSEIGYTAGVAAMTKITSQLLNILKEQHNFRFDYSIAGRWIGSPKRNSTLAVTNSLLWEEQDLSSTCARIFPKWLDWVDIIHPPTTNLQTKIYYLIPNKGVGNYENQFLTPMSNGVWLCSLFSCIACTVVLAGAALMENRPEPGTYAFFSVFAIVCQEAFEDGVPLPEKKESQGRRLTLMVIGVMSMLLYNYYTSSVVSWLLNAAAPSIANLDGLINSDLEIIFEDIGYTRGWLDNPGFFYYSGFKNPKEDELRDKKVTNAKRTVDVLQSVNNGIELVRTGKYAFHTEPYSASQAISKTFEEEELCNLGALQMMLPAHVYIMVQKKSPYKEFLDWSLLRLSERGHVKAIRARFAGTIPACSGIKPRALALGQAAPAFLLLFEMTVLAWMILALEVLWHKRSLLKKRGLRVGRE